MRFARLEFGTSRIVERDGSVLEQRLDDDSGLTGFRLRRVSERNRGPVDGVAVSRPQLAPLVLDESRPVFDRRARIRRSAVRFRERVSVDGVRAPLRRDDLEEVRLPTPPEERPTLDDTLAVAAFERRPYRFHVTTEIVELDASANAVSVGRVVVEEVVIRDRATRITLDAPVAILAVDADRRRRPVERFLGDHLVGPVLRWRECRTGHVGPVVVDARDARETPSDETRPESREVRSTFHDVNHSTMS
ncbi:hypothetical protein ACFQO4_11700 [Saliphagus sp. GCM10025334]